MRAGFGFTIVSELGVSNFPVTVKKPFLGS
jgi:hypothetical protein